MSCVYSPTYSSSKWLCDLHQSTCVSDHFQVNQYSSTTRYYTLNLNLIKLDNETSEWASPTHEKMIKINLLDFGGHTLQNCSCIAIYHPLWKPSKLDKPEHCWRNKDELISDVLLSTASWAIFACPYEQKLQGAQHYNDGEILGKLTWSPQCLYKVNLLRIAKSLFSTEIRVF